MARNHRDDHQHQLNLFPLHPESLVEDKDIHDENVAFLFDSEPGATLNSLLAGASCSEEDCLSAPPSLTYANSKQDNDQLGDVVGGKSGNSSTCASSKLVRAAMRNKQREPSEEKWVCYSELLVEKKEVEAEVSSCAAEVWCPKRMPRKMDKGLSLKLDYEGILNAWSDKGPLLIAEETPPQTVPDLHHDHYQQQLLVHDSANVLVESWGSVGNEWAVPEMVESLKVIKVKEEDQDHEGLGKDNIHGWKKRQMMREASVLRYKEKRQSRLFSKRIRYEVRRLNAEKRPRIKGRFVKIIRS
ncbi:zinc finger protein CONSTANS-LIKE 16-like [Juglans regia]|uniref:Zinc finger protein CONSTANS-LIKE 16-like n=2 Tax=Juglans regia TaxID=51240 RepID=A0A2I4E4H9_JUGRE|nr:zinc finger protein CONSTANS-LIKE 16-like [Juglans regia]